MQDNQTPLNFEKSLQKILENGDTKSTKLDWFATGGTRDIFIASNGEAKYIVKVDKTQDECRSPTAKRNTSNSLNSLSEARQVTRKIGNECSYLTKFYSSGNIEDDRGNKRNFIVYEYFPSKNLEAKLESDGFRETLQKKQGIETFQRIAKDIGEGLKWIHNKNLVHRDLKADNVLINDSLDIKVDDYANAKEIGSQTNSLDSTLAGRYINDPRLLLENETLQPYNDIYSLSKVLLFALTGDKGPELFRDKNNKLRFEYDNQSLVTKSGKIKEKNYEHAINTLLSKLDSLPKPYQRLRKVFKNALCLRDDERKGIRRYQSIDEFTQAMDDALKPTTYEKIKQKWVTGVIVAAAVGIVGFGFMHHNAVEQERSTYRLEYQQIMEQVTEQRAEFAESINEATKLFYQVNEQKRSLNDLGHQIPQETQLLLNETQRTFYESVHINGGRELSNNLQQQLEPIFTEAAQYRISPNELFNLAYYSKNNTVEDNVLFANIKLASALKILRAASINTNRHTVYDADLAKKTLEDLRSRY